MKKINVLWVTDDPWQKTGYGMVGRNVLTRLVKEENLNIYSLGLQHGGAEIEWEGIKVLPRMSNNEGFDVIGKYILDKKIDVVITLRDVGLQAGYVEGINHVRKMGWKGKWYGYLPIDSNTFVPEWLNIVKHMDGVIAMAESGGKVINETTKRLGHEIKPVVIPHGVDMKVFKPNREEVRKKLTDSGVPYSDMFIIGAVGRNQGRKMWNALVRGFAKFAKDKDDVALLLHTDKTPSHPADGWMIDYIADKRGCLNKVYFTNPNLDMYSRFLIDDKKMCEIYNAFDVFALVTGGEGFGVPLIEAQACGLPIITTAYTTGFELVEGHGELVPILKDKHGRDVMMEGQNGVEFAVADDIVLAETLEKLYKDKKLRDKYSKGSIEHAKKYDWDEINKQWVKLINEQPKT